MEKTTHGMVQRYHSIRFLSGCGVGTRGLVCFSATASVYTKLLFPLLVLLLSLPSRSFADSTLVTDSTIDRFRPKLLEPLAVWLSRGLFVAKVGESLDFSIPLAGNSAGEPLINAEGLFTGDLESLARLTARAPMESEIASDLAAGKSAEVSAMELLAHSLVVQSKLRNSQYDIDVNWYSSQSITRRASGILYREWWTEVTTTVPAPPSPAKAKAAPTRPGAAAPAEPPLIPAGPVESGPLQLAEVFRLHEPAVVGGYAQLLLRRLDGVERYSVFSPVVAKLRPLPSSIRSDVVLQGQLAPSDLMIFGENLHSTAATFLGTTDLFAFFASETALPAEIVDGEDGKPVIQVAGMYQAAEGRGTMVRWNGEQNQFAQFVPWMPLSTTLHPRRVLIVQATSKDPFTAFGKIILFLDRETLLPLYKLVYSEWGALERVVVAVWAIAESKDLGRVPFLASVLSVSANGSQATSVTTRNLRVAAPGQNAAKMPVRRYLDSHALLPVAPAPVPPESVPPADAAAPAVVAPESAKSAVEQPAGQSPAVETPAVVPPVDPVSDSESSPSLETPEAPRAEPTGLPPAKSGLPPAKTAVEPTPATSPAEADPKTVPSLPGLN
jgi:hypothetical protein